MLVVKVVFIRYIILFHLIHTLYNFVILCIYTAYVLQLKLSSSLSMLCNQHVLIGYRGYLWYSTSYVAYDLCKIHFSWCRYISMLTPDNNLHVLQNLFPRRNIYTFESKHSIKHNRHQRSNWCLYMSMLAPDNNLHVL